MNYDLPQPLSTKWHYAIDDGPIVQNEALGRDFGRVRVTDVTVTLIVENDGSHHVSVSVEGRQVTKNGDPDQRVIYLRTVFNEEVELAYMQAWAQQHPDIAGRVFDTAMREALDG